MFLKNCPIRIFFEPFYLIPNVIKSVKLWRNFDSIRSDPFSIPLRNTKFPDQLKFPQTPSKKSRENDLEYQHISG